MRLLSNQLTDGWWYEGVLGVIWNLSIIQLAPKNEKYKYDSTFTFKEDWIIQSISRLVVII